MDVQPDTRAPQEENAGKDCGQQNRAENQHAGKAKRPDQNIRKPGRIAFGRGGDIDDDGRVGLLLKSPEQKSGNHFISILEADLKVRTTLGWT